MAAKYLAEYEKGRYRLKEEYARWVAVHTALPQQPHSHAQTLDSAERGVSPHRLVELLLQDCDLGLHRAWGADTGGLLGWSESPGRELRAGGVREKKG